MNHQQHYALSDKEAELISEIANRACIVCMIPRDSYLGIIDDVSSLYTFGLVNLNLDKLLKASVADFSHDINGIRNHLNRSTSKLEGNFTLKATGD